MNKLILACSVVLLFSCNKVSSNRELNKDYYKRIMESGLIEKYSGYEIYPHSYGDIIYINNDTLSIRFNIKSQEFLGYNDRLSLMEKQTILDTVLNDLKKYSLISIRNEKGLMYFYSNFSDSTYQELLEADPHFKDIRVNKDVNTSYNYVFAYKTGNDSASGTLVEKHIQYFGGRVINSNWHYYRSSTYNSFGKQIK